MTHARILGTGSRLPERVVHNRELEAMVDTTDAWIRERTGIVTRHIAAEGETTCDLAEGAARAALAAADVAIADIDLIIVATTTPDRIFPSTACLLGRRLGSHGAPAFDVQAVCTGFVYALGIADKFIRTGSARRALVVGAETLSRIVDWSDRSTCVLFGDGAGAVVLGADAAPGIIATHLHADGAHADLLQVPPLQDGIGGCIAMSGNEVFRIAVNTLGRLVEETLAASGLGSDDIDWLIPHQANERILMAVARRLGLPPARVIVTVDRHGNTSAASIPLALDEAVRDGRIRPGQRLLLEAFGGGFTWGSALIAY